MFHEDETPIDFDGYVDNYSIKSLHLLEGIYAFEFMKAAHITDFTTAFLLKTGRKPNNADITLNKYFQDGTVKRHFTAIYESHWNGYASQAIMEECGILAASTDDVRRIYKNVLGYYPSYDDTHIVNRLVRVRRNDLLLGYYQNNVWQVLEVIACLEYLGVDKKSSNISALYNKIYKRGPKDFEIELCKKIDLSKNPQEIEDEVKSIVQIKDEFKIKTRRYY